MKTILIQLDPDPLPSSFDRVVAVDAGVEEILSYGGVSESDVERLVHGAIFTRGINDLKSTAIFIGGSDVAEGEVLLHKVEKTFFGPMRVSVMMDANGCNTTASAAVLAAGKHLTLKDTTALVLGATGPVGHRVCQLLSSEGCHVRIGSRSLERANDLCEHLLKKNSSAQLDPCLTGSEEELKSSTQGAELIIAAGAAGAKLLTADQRKAVSSLKVAIDLNAVPPLGLEGIEVTDKAKERDGVVCYGAIGVGGTKMKIHKAALKQLFESRDQVLTAETIYDIGRTLEK